MNEREMDRLHDKHRARVRELLDRYDNSDPGPEVLDGPSGGSRLAASGSFTISTPAYLSVRISGENIQQGSIDTDLFDDIIVPLQGEIRAASRPSYLTKLELVSITSGSTVLHFQPRLTSLDDDGAIARDVESTAIAESIDRVLDVHDLIEARANLSELQNGPSALYDGLARLTNGLTRHNAELEVFWRPNQGQVRPSRLGRDGLAYARNLFERREVSETIDVWGYVYSLSLTGQIVLKRNVTKRNSPTFVIEVPEPDKTLATFSLNALASLRVVRTSVIDQLGRSLATSYRYLSVLEHQPQFPSSEDEEGSE